MIPSGRGPRKYVSGPVGPSPRTRSNAVSKSMKSNRRRGTQPELLLSRRLRKRILKTHLPGSPDFVYPRQKVAVFVHGCYWHRCPIHARSLPRTHAAFWKRKFARNVERDRLNREELESMGWKVLEFWEHEVKANPRDCARRILVEARERGRSRAFD